MILWTAQNFCGDEDQDDRMLLNDGSSPPASIALGSQSHPRNGKDYDWQNKLSRHKRSDPSNVAVIKQLEVETEIEKRIGVELWKAHYPTDSLDVSLNKLLKECQRFSTLIYKLDDLHKTRQKLISRLPKASDKIHHIDIRPQQELSNGLNKASGRRFHVVIAGINKYDDPRTSPLRGCVHDAMLFLEYCIEDLSVPADQIKLFLSPTGEEDIPFPFETPTRENIMNALYDLHDNPNIKPDDAIIIFYAGHGQSYHAAEATYEFTTRSNACVEAISPVDRNTLKSNTDGTEETVVDISDREINVILGEIAKNCANITLILDCCHTGSGIRGSSTFSSLQLGDKEFLTSRYCSPIPSAVRLMFQAADKARRLSPNRPCTAHSNFRANMKSHVLIAAAKEYEEAVEYTNRTTGVTQGFFTSRFLSVLRSPLGRDSTTTYRDLIGSPGLVMPFQTAFVAGKKTATLWFA